MVLFLLLLITITIIIRPGKQSLGKRMARLLLYQATAAPSSPPQSSKSPKCFGRNVSVRSLQITESVICFGNASYSVTSLSPAEIFYYLMLVSKCKTELA